MNGKGDRMFYAHSSDRHPGFDSWWLIDLRAFRAGLIRQEMNGWPVRCGDKRNRDGSAFKWFDIRSFPKEPALVLASSGG